MDENENPALCDLETNSKKYKVADGIGKIEDLPETILEHILSFLPMKDATRTSVLSKKWQYLWTSFPELVFLEMFFSSRKLFMNSVERVLLLHHTPIKRFHLDCNVCHSAFPINLWVSKVVKQDVQDCHITQRDVPEIYMLPRCLFFCKTLTRLCLEMQCTLRLPSHIYLPSLKFLTLGNITFLDANSIQQLFSSQALEELIMYNCCWYHLRIVSISAPKLRTLSIIDCVVTKEGCCQFVIHGCKLHFLNISGQISNDYLLSNSSVEHADIDIFCFGNGALRQVAYRLSKILHDMHAVRWLRLHSDVIQIIEAGPGSTPWGIGLPVFHNMKGLQLGLLAIDILGNILQHTPHLQSLCLAGGLEAFYGKEIDYILNPVPPCLLSSLKMMKVTLRFQYGDLFALKNLLGCAVVLEQLEIIYRPQDIDLREGDLQRELLNYACASKNCKITFSAIY